MNRFATIFLLTCWFGSSMLWAETLSVRVACEGTGEVNAVAFKLSKAAQLQIKGGVARIPGKIDKKVFETRYYGWILDSHTRKVVWKTPNDRRPKKGGPVTEIDQTIYLEAGNYELYYTSVRYLYEFKMRGAAAPEINQLLKRRVQRQNKIDKDQLHLAVTGPADVMGQTNYESYIKQLTERAAVSIRAVTDNQRITQAFTLMDTTTLGIYAQGEGYRRTGEIFDYAWIEDVVRNERVWEMNARDTNLGGGGSKNLLVREKLTLPKGRYLVHYVTDDSHSYDSWNDQPPFDPGFWGITLWPDKESDQKNVKKRKLKVFSKPLVSIKEVTNSQRIVKGIEVKEPISVRVICMGEVSHGEYADWGWISDAETGEVVWEADRKSLRHAGGGKKNRVAIDLLKLNKGRYLVHYKSDDSHAFNTWNTAKPSRPNLWGITLWALDGESAEKVNEFKFAQTERRKAILFIRGDKPHVYKEKSFTVNTRRPAKIQVVAYGEGTDDGMVDFGWIENDDTGRLVWEMKYEQTEHAGGAGKNRKVVAEIQLKPGNYKVYYETDDSHDPKDWNAAPPENADQYGIKLYVLE